VKTSLKGVHFTPTQKRILRVLSDGEPHYAEELQKVLYDDLGGRGNLHRHISALRNILKPLGHTISLVRVDCRSHYQHVLLLPKGRKLF
jgi:hypothetical protein